jgi:hypothetical protein
MRACWRLNPNGLQEFLTGSSPLPGLVRRDAVLAACSGEGSFAMAVVNQKNLRERRNKVPLVEGSDSPAIPLLPLKNSAASPEKFRCSAE